MKAFIEKEKKSFKKEKKIFSSRSDKRNLYKNYWNFIDKFYKNKFYKFNKFSIIKFKQNSPFLTFEFYYKNQGTQVFSIILRKKRFTKYKKPINIFFHQDKDYVEKEFSVYFEKFFNESSEDYNIFYTEVFSRNDDNTCLKINDRQRRFLKEFCLKYKNFFFLNNIYVDNVSYGKYSFLNLKKQITSHEKLEILNKKKYDY